jgi:hypothetical protein
MDDMRIGSLGFVASLFGQTKDGSKKRSRQRHVEPQEEPTDQVTLFLLTLNQVIPATLQLSVLRLTEFTRWMQPETAHP